MFRKFSLVLSLLIIVSFVVNISTARADLTISATSIATDSTLNLQGGNIGINTVSPAQALDVTGSGQFSGSLGLGGTAVSADSLINSAFTVAPSGTFGRALNLTVTGSTASKIYQGVFSSATSTASSGTVFAVTGGSFSGVNNGAGTVSTLTGLQGNVTSSSGPVTTMVGLATLLNLSASATTVYGARVQMGVGAAGSATSLTGFILDGSLNGGGTVTTLKGIDLGNWGSVSATTSYGIYADTGIDKGSTKYFIYSTAAAPSYIDGQLSLGVAPAGTSKLVVNGNVTLGPATSHIISTQTTAPTGSVSMTGLSAATCTSCTDTRGVITTTGTPSATGTVTLNFNTSYASAPIVVITPANASAQASNAYVSATATGSFTITTTVAAPGATPSWYYMVMQ